MDRYNGTQEMEAVSVDPAAEWAAPGGETGLEEKMSRLGSEMGMSYTPRGPVSLIVSITSGLDSVDTEIVLHADRTSKFGASCKYNTKHGIRSSGSVTEY